MPESTATKKRGPQFSLSTLVVLMTFATLLVGLVASLRNNRHLADMNQTLAKENRRLRDEVGELSIEDKRQMHAIRIPLESYGEWGEWKWRIWIPEGQSYRLRCVGGEIPAEGWPQDGGTIWLRDAGEQVIRYQMRRDATDDQWYGHLYTRGASIGRNHHPWVQWGPSTSTTGGVGTSTRVFQVDQRVELCRHRVSQQDSSDKIEDPAPGFLIWLEPL